MKKLFRFCLFIVFIMLQFSSPLFALLAKGDPSAATGETFSFDIGFAVFDSGSELSTPRLWVASGDADMANKSDTVKPYGLSIINQLAAYVPTNVVPTATPMANQEGAIIYSSAGQSASANPIWGAQFALFDVAAQKPVFVVADTLAAPNNQSKLYGVHTIEHYATQTDDQKNKTELLLYDLSATTANDKVNSLLATVDGGVYFSHAVGTFGADNTSKIARLTRASLTTSTTTDKDGKITSSSTIPYFKLMADTTINTATSALTGGTANLTALGSSVYINFMFAYSYVALDVTANAAGGSCAMGIVMASLIPDTNSSTGYSFQFDQLIPSSVATSEETVISTLANNQLRISSFAQMRTSTGLNYMIVARDNGTGPQTIYALPLVSAGSSIANVGKIADFTSIKNNFNLTPHLFSSRGFDTPISNSAQINPSNPSYSAQLTVGQNTPPLDAPNSVVQMFTLGDSVYVVIGNAYTATQSPGTFRSQAIFAKDGHIVNWTPWARVQGSDQQMMYSYIDNKTISSFYVAHVTTNFRAVYQTLFSNATNLAPFLQKAMAATGNIQGLFNFPQDTAYFNNSISLLIATGYNQVTIGQTGYIDSSIFQIKPMEASDVVTSTLDDQRSLVAAELATDNNCNNWLFVGGATGLFTLTCDDSGYTWYGNLESVATFSSGQTWKKVGNFSFVKKLVWDQTYLYVMTQTAIYRIALDPNKFLATPTADLDAELILSSSNLNSTGFFLDMIIDTGYCVLGTTTGLYAGNLTPSAILSKINIPDGLPAVTQLIAINEHSQPQRNFKDFSNLCVLNSSFGTQQSRLNRFVIENSTIVPFNDFMTSQAPAYTQGNPTSFVKFNNYISNYFTDGTWYLASSYFLGPNQPNTTQSVPPGNLQSTPFVQQLFSGIYTGLSSSQIIMPMLSAYSPLLFLSRTNNLIGLLRETTSGSVIIAGNFEAQNNA